MARKDQEKDQILKKMHYILIRQASHLILLVHWVRVSSLVKKKTKTLFLQDMHIYHVKCALATLSVGTIST